MSKGFIYALETSIETKVPFKEAYELYKKSPIELFEKFREEVESILDRVHRVRVNASFEDKDREIIVLDYTASCYLGDVNVKIIYAESLNEGLKEFYWAREIGRLKIY